MKTVFAILLVATTFAGAAERQQDPPWKRPEKWEGAAPGSVKAAGEKETGKKTAIAYEGGDGSSMEKAVVIKGAKDSGTGIRAEYDWVGKKFPGYRLKKQSVRAKDGKSYDVLAIVTKDGKEMEIHFDISEFFGKY